MFKIQQLLQNKDNIPISDKIVVVDASKVVNGCSVLNLNEIMTDDEDDNIAVTVPKKIIPSFIKMDAKAILHPIEKSSVKKQVKASDKLGIDKTSEISVLTTRTKTGAKVKAEEEETAASTPKGIKDNQNRKTRPRRENKYLTTVSNSANKELKTFTTFFPIKSSSTLNPSDAIKNREAQLQAQAEENSKKLLEKEMKALQVREAQEITKMKTFDDLEKIKERKRKQMLLKKQVNIKKQQDALECRKQELLQKASEEKRKEEERQKVAQEMQERLQQEALQNGKKTYKATEEKKKTKCRLSIYLREKTPLLPTEHDQEDDTVRKFKRPAWASSRKILRILRQIQHTDKNVISTFYMMKATTPDLQDIFENIDPTKLKRTSSAIWRVPPRFTMIPQIIDV